jgi:predicted anti-sigma-YlaC factor YlaD
MRLLIGQVCERARAWASLHVDGELSQLERLLLDAHLASCADCREFAACVDATTGMLRAAELETLAEPVRLPAPRYRVGRLVAPLAAAAAVLAAAVIGAGAGLHSLTSGSPSQASAAAARSDTPNEMRSVRRDQLIAESHPVHRDKAIF